MNRRTRCVLLVIVIGVAMVLPGQLLLLAQEPTKVPVRPSPGVIFAWEKAGAEFGWISGRPVGDSCTGGPTRHSRSPGVCRLSVSRCSPRGVQSRFLHPRFLLAYILKETR